MRAILGHKDGAWDQAAAEGLAKQTAARFLAQGNHAEAELTTKMAFGGACGICGRPYVAVRTKDEALRVDFGWYRPDCECEETEADRKVRIGLVNDRLALAGVPTEFVGEYFENWDYGAGTANESMRIVLQYAKDREYRSTGLVLYGPSGCGKTRCAVGVLRRAVSDGLSVRFVKMAELDGRYADRERVRRLVSALIGTDMVLLDDLEKLGAAPESFEAEQVFRLVDGLCGAGRRIVATSNLPDHPAFVARFGEPVVSRLMGSCMFIEFRGEDYRVRRAQMERLNRAEARKNVAG